MSLGETFVVVAVLGEKVEFLDGIAAQDIAMRGAESTVMTVMIAVRAGITAHAGAGAHEIIEVGVLEGAFCLLHSA